MHTIWVIAKNTFKESIRERLLYGVLIIALLVTAASFFLATISFDQNGRVLQDVGLASIHLFALFICVFVATNSLHKDYERRALYLLFPKPISRGQYIVGKYLGFILLLFTTLLILGGLYSIGTAFTDPSLLLGTVINLCFSFMEISLLTAVAILFACFTAALNASLYTLALFVIGHSLGTLNDYVAKLSAPFLHGVVTVAYYLLPNLEKFDVRQAVLYGIPLPAGQVSWSIVYWIIYTALVLALAISVIKKQEV